MFREFKREVETSLKNSLNKTGIQQELNEKGVKEPIDLMIEEPREIADLASTLPFSLASKLNKNPIELGGKITKNIDTEKHRHIKRVEFSKPGYINYYIDRSQLKHLLKNILIEKENYGSLTEKKQKIVLEHTSANPTGPLHIGHLRNAVLGDTLTRILKAAGHTVETHYYVNDIGRQMAILLHGVRKYGLDENNKPDIAVGKTYTKTNKNMDDRDEQEIEKLMNRFEQNDQDTYTELTETVEHCLNGMKETLQNIGVNHDLYIRESKFVRNGSVEKITKKLREHAVKDGALKIEFNDMDKELILLREDGTSVYALRDIAYHEWKSNRGHIINVLGADHKLYINQLSRALELIDIDKPESIVFEFVSLPKGKMSTRKGEYISIDQLREKLIEKAMKEVSDRRPEKPEKWRKKIAREVAKAAIRFEFIQVAPEKPITFNIDQAVSFNERGAPFIQYAHARATSILNRSENINFENIEIPEKILNENKETQKLLKTISKYSYEVEKAAEERKIHRFAEYTLNIASDFNQFYRDVPVLNTGHKEQTRLAVVKATQITLKNAINLLGFKAPKEM
ncbi:Arginyl-tRNA synthetase [Methanonatronarchaeum thermophilum]|uniref:Arginine--tRNA ligase n=1 Tax=Methanonatronarchaeum thermophilum TaxID=1927129 RepID=A0A1Y3GEE2_9EURY|nr:arginine--tRNA ligase [Methanonatronarchaeum thermophilum]OUJ18554.1 Arginyl-tRNA synthetase [Methanonatronarchaeum thermophilum]